MVKVIGTATAFDGKTVNINENFRSTKEAKHFKAFLGRGSKTKVVYKRKVNSPVRRSSMFGGGFAIRPLGVARFRV
jgi:hypothetical protein